MFVLNELIKKNLALGIKDTIDVVYLGNGEYKNKVFKSKYPYKKWGISISGLFYSDEYPEENFKEEFSKKLWGYTYNSFIKNCTKSFEEIKEVPTSTMGDSSVSISMDNDDKSFFTIEDQDMLLPVSLEHNPYTYSMDIYLNYNDFVMPRQFNYTTTAFTAPEKQKFYLYNVDNFMVDPDIINFNEGFLVTRVEEEKNNPYGTIVCLITYKNKKKLSNGDSSDKFSYDFEIFYFKDKRIFKHDSKTIVTNSHEANILDDIDLLYDIPGGFRDRFVDILERGKFEIPRVQE